MIRKSGFAERLKVSDFGGFALVRLAPELPDTGVRVPRLVFGPRVLPLPPISSEVHRPK